LVRTDQNKQYTKQQQTNDGEIRIPHQQPRDRCLGIVSLSCSINCIRRELQFVNTGSRN